MSEDKRILSIRQKYIHLCQSGTEEEKRRLDLRFSNYINSILSIDLSFNKDLIMNLAFNSRSLSDDHNLYYLFNKCIKYANKIKNHLYIWPYNGATDIKEATAGFRKDFPITYELVAILEATLILMGYINTKTPLFITDDLNIKELICLICSNNKNKMYLSNSQPFFIKYLLKFGKIYAKISKKELHQYLADFMKQIGPFSAKVLTRQVENNKATTLVMSSNYNKLCTLIEEI